MPITSIPTNDRRERFVASGGQTVFPFDFPVFASGDLAVVRLRSGGELQLQIGADYTLNGAGNQGGGNIALTSGALAGDVITLISRMPESRSAQFVNGGDLPASALEAEFNRLLIMLQQIAARQARALQLAETDNVLPKLPPTPTRANRLLVFDSAGAPTVADIPGAGTSLTGNASLSTVTATGSTTARTLGERFGEVANVRDFGAVGNGVANDTAAFQAALATGKNVFAPKGTYKITTGLQINSNGQLLIGDGQNQTVLLPQGNFNVITLAEALDHCGVENVTFNAVGMTGGYCIYVNGADRVYIGRIRMDEPFGAVYVYQCNSCTLHEIYIQKPRGPYCFHLYGNDPNRSDVIRMTSVNVGGLGGAARVWTGIYWDGFVNTLQANNCTFVNPLRGMHVVNTGGGGPGMLPYFAEVSDIEFDFVELECIRLEAGEGFNFVNLYAQGSSTTHNIYIGPNVSQVTIANPYIRGAALSGVYIAGQDVTITGGQVSFNSFPNFNVSPGIFVAGTARRVSFAGVQSGQIQGIGAVQSYGLFIAPGAQDVNWTGGSLQGNLYDSWRDDSGSTDPSNVQVVGAAGSNTSQFSFCLLGTQAGRNAVAAATVTGGVVTAVTVSDGGQGYTQAPSVLVDDLPGTGSGATLSCTVVNGVVTAVAVLTGGSGYTSAKVFFSAANTFPTLRPRYFGQPNSPMIISSAGSGAVQLRSDQGIAFQAGTVSNSVNFLQANGSSAGNAVSLFAAGADTNLTMGYTAKGSGFHTFGNGNGVAFQAVANAASSVNYVIAAASVSGVAPALFAAGSDANINLSILPKGTGVLNLGGTTAGAAGAVAGYLNVIVGGTSYKMPLHTP